MPFELSAAYQCSRCCLRKARSRIFTGLVPAEAAKRLPASLSIEEMGLPIWAGAALGDPFTPRLLVLGVELEPA